MRYRTLLSTLAVLSLACAVAAVSEADRILERCRAAHSSVPGLRAGFVMTSGADTTRGRVWMQRGNRFRHETARSTVVTDGQSLWVYSGELNQVVITPAEGPGGDPPPMIKPPEGGTPRLAGVDTVDGVRCHVLDLVPVYGAGAGEGIRIWVQSGTNLMCKLQYSDPFSGQTTYTLTGLEIVMDQPDSVFSYEPPPGAEVVDLRGDGEGMNSLLERLGADE